MPYPTSPFPLGFSIDCLFDETIDKIQIAETLQWLCTTPKMSSFRVNTLATNVEDMQAGINKHLKDLGLSTIIPLERHNLLDEVIILHHKPINESKLQIHENEVMVDAICGAAVLRGAHIFAPGVLSMLPATRRGSIVSVYVDLAKKCKKGLQKIYEENKVFIGNGQVEMDRNDLFKEKVKNPSGVAIRMLTTTSNCPPLNLDFLPLGSILLQNLPSVICIKVLDPQPGENILDMCASPGNKTTHIAALMRNSGIITAVDKTPGKVAVLAERCKTFGAKVNVLQFDSTKIVENAVFPKNSFDRILLDAPCSALGKRLQFVNTTTEKVLKSYVPLQRKLFTNAVDLLKDGGTLVYSTCTITTRENEGIVSWALKHFPNIQLEESKPRIGGYGWSYPGLEPEHLEKVQRFGPNQPEDSVGFFIAKFQKRCR